MGEDGPGSAGESRPDACTSPVTAVAAAAGFSCMAVPISSCSCTVDYDMMGLKQNLRRLGEGGGEEGLVQVDVEGLRKEPVARSCVHG